MAPREVQLPEARPTESRGTVDTTKSSATAHPSTTAEKTRPCSGCGERHPRRELVEVGPEHLAFGHGVREGERYCRPCARRRGVL